MTATSLARRSLWAQAAAVPLLCNLCVRSLHPIPSISHPILSIRSNSPDGSCGNEPSMRSALFLIPSRCRRTRPDREVNTGFHFEKGNGFASDGSSRKAEPSAPYSWYAPTDPTQRMGPYHAKTLAPKWKPAASSHGLPTTNQTPPTRLATTTTVRLYYPRSNAYLELVMHMSLRYGLAGLILSLNLYAQTNPPSQSLVPELNKVPKLTSREFFGIYLGDMLEAALTRAREASLDVSMTGVRYESDLHQYTEHTIKGSLDRSTSIDRTIVIAFHDRICTIRAYFKSPTGTYLDTLRKALTEKYAAPVDTEADIWPESRKIESRFETTVDNQKVVILLTLFRHRTANTLHNCFLQYDYQQIIDIHDAKVKEVRESHPNEGW